MALPCLTLPHLTSVEEVTAATALRVGDLRHHRNLASLREDERQRDVLAAMQRGHPGEEHVDAVRHHRDGRVSRDGNSRHGVHPGAPGLSATRKATCPPT